MKQITFDKIVGKTVKAFSLTDDTIRLELTDGTFVELKSTDLKDSTDKIPCDFPVCYQGHQPAPNCPYCHGTGYKRKP